VFAPVVRRANSGRDRGVRDGTGRWDAMTGFSSLPGVVATSRAAAHPPSHPMDSVLLSINNFFSGRLVVPRAAAAAAALTPPAASAAE